MKLTCQMKEKLQHALLGEITPQMKAVAVSYQSETVLIRCYFDRVPDEYDKESLESIAVNFDSNLGDLGDTVKIVNVECQQSDLSIGSLDSMDMLLYARREY